MQGREAICSASCVTGNALQTQERQIRGWQPPCWHPFRAALQSAPEAPSTSMQVRPARIALYDLLCIA